MYNRIALLLWLSLWSLSLWAGPISREAAGRIAAQFVRVSPISELRQADAEAKADAAYYIFNDIDRDGFVIVSGDDALPPVLGYSGTGRLHEGRMPVQLAALLRQYEQRVQALRSGAAFAMMGDRKIPKRYPKVIKEPLLTSEWDQGAPYNMMTPKNDDGQGAVTGCVATAMAQLMYYHRWPLQGTGTQTYQPPFERDNGKPYYPEQHVDFSKSRYDWDNMLDQYWDEDENALGNPTQRKAIAKLMYDVGVGVKMMYQPNEEGSGAWTTDAAIALRTFFGYDARLIYRLHNNALYLETIRQELDQDRPLFMAGGSIGGAHAWILDGYDENGFVHVNWGWGGASNGYYDLNLMNPPVLGIGGGAGGGFSQVQELIVAHPRKSGVSYPKLPEVDVYAFSGSLLPSEDEAKTAANLNQYRRAYIDFPLLMSTAEDDHHIQAGVGLYDATDKLLSASIVHADLALKFLEPGGSASQQLLQALPQSLAEGTYRFKMIWRDLTASAEPLSSWQQVRGSNYVEIKVNGAGQIALGTVTQLDETVRLAKPLSASPVVWVERHGALEVQLESRGIVALEGNLLLLLRQSPTDEPEVIDLGSISIPGEGQTNLRAPFTNKVLARKAPQEYYLAEHRDPQPLKPGVYQIALGLVQIDPTTTDAVKLEDMLPILDEFGPMTVEFKVPGKHPILEYAPGYGLDFYTEDGEVLEQDTLDLDVLTKSPLSIFGMINNVGTEHYFGEISFVLEHIETHARQWIARVKKADIPASGRAPLEADLVWDNFAGLSEGTYRLHIEAKVGEKTIDVWSPLAARYYVTLRGKMLSGQSVETVSQANLVAYPIPARDYITLANAAPGQKARLVALDGRLVAELPVEAGQRLSVGHLSRGIYILEHSGRQCRVVLH